MVILTIVALALAACDGPARAPSAGASATKPAPKPSTSGSIVVDDFTDPSSGWAIPTIAEYRSGNLVVGHVEPSSTFIPAPINFRGSRIVKATASIDGSGESAIGVFCQADLEDIPFTGYIGSVDTAAQTVTITRVDQIRKVSVLAEDPIDVSISLDEPLDLVLRCLQENETSRISFTVNDTTLVEVSDSSSLDGRDGGVYFNHEEPGTLGVFGDFEMIQLDAN
jgi:hypothetical protein